MHLLNAFRREYEPADAYACHSCAKGLSVGLVESTLVGKVQGDDVEDVNAGGSLDNKKYGCNKYGTYCMIHI